jgi:hypothetical protein
MTSWWNGPPCRSRLYGSGGGLFEKIIFSIELFLPAEIWHGYEKLSSPIANIYMEHFEELARDLV